MFRQAIGVVLLAASGATYPQGADVGLINFVEGAAEYTSRSGSPRSVQPFMRVREGDRFNLPAGARLRVIFFEGGRQERWLGPASFRARYKESEPIAGKPEEVLSLPAGASQRIARVPELMQNAKLGGIQVRGGLTPRQEASLDQQKSVSDARIAYERMRREMPSDDITPELFLYSALHEYLLYDEMMPVVEEMLRKQPNNDDVKALAAWVRSKTAR